MSAMRCGSGDKASYFFVMIRRRFELRSRCSLAVALIRRQRGRDSAQVWQSGSVDTRWGAADAGRIRRYAAELVALVPDVILAVGSTTVGPLIQTTRNIPIVFVQVIDPVGGGFVESLARPGGNTTGFTQFEYGLGGKWLELLKQVAPGVTRVAVIRDSALTSGTAQWAAIQVVAPSFGIELSPIGD